MTKRYSKEEALSHSIQHDYICDIYECPDCGFEYNSGHEVDDEEGGYECPNCEGIELSEVVYGLNETLRQEQTINERYKKALEQLNEMAIYYDGKGWALNPDKVGSIVAKALNDCED